MNILHVASISCYEANGMNKIIPEHIKNQSKFEKVALFNYQDYIPASKDDNYNVFLKKNYEKFDIEKLEKPFNNPDIVIFHGVYKYTHIEIYKNLIEHDIPYIILPHGSLTKQAQKYKKIKKTIGNLLLFNKFIKKAKYIQYLSEKEKNNSLKFKNNSFVLGNGIYVPEQLLKKYNKEDKKEFVYIGRIDRYYKGLDILIKAIGIIQNEMRNKKAIISIYGPPRNNEIEILNKSIKKLGIEDIVEIKGKRSFWKRKRRDTIEIIYVYTVVKI